MLGVGAQWPPESEEVRIDGYRRFEEMYSGDHRKAFAERVSQFLYNKGGDGLTWLTLDYPKSIVEIPAELMVGQPPVISYEDPELNNAWRGIASRSRWDAALLELAQDAGMRGDAVIAARYGEEGVVVEPRPAYVYFPTLSPDNVRVIREECIAWERPFEGKIIIRVDRYKPGRSSPYVSGILTREAYLLNGQKRLGRRMIGAELARVLGEDEEEEAIGLERSPLVHYPNTRPGNKFFGSSDLGGGLPTLFQAVDHRLSEMDRTLDKHGSPKMSGPASLIDKNGMVNLASDFFGVSPGQAPPQYLTWDSQQIAQFKQLEAIIEEILKHSRISKLLMGFVNGASYDSARAYKMQLAPTLSKVDKKTTYLDASTREIVRVAVAMETGRSYLNTPEPNIRWRHGLPKDLTEMATTNSQRIANGTLSRHTATMAELDCDEQTATNERAKVLAEQQSFGGAAPAPPSKIPTPEDKAPAADEGSEETR